MKIISESLATFKRLSGLNEIEEKVVRKENLIFHAPEKTTSTPENSFKIFLAGTIDMDDATGKATSKDWQKELENRVKKETFAKQVVIFNPRRDDWPEDGSSEMYRQVHWELEHMEKANLIVMNIGENSKSPISLLELGMHSQDEPKKMIVFCKKGFYRYDNVKIVCERYGVPLFETNECEDIIKEVTKRIK